MSSHKFPYGNTSKIQTLSEHEYKQVWKEVIDHNIDKDAPSTNGPTIFIYPEDLNKHPKEDKPSKSKKRKQIFKHHAQTMKDATTEMNPKISLTDVNDDTSKASKSELATPRNQASAAEKK